jgi:hypothetical protein
MSEFRKYDKIHRLGKDETIGILEGLCHVQEKIDGANASIWLDDNGQIQCGSRNRHLIEDNFNGFVDYARSHEGIMALLAYNPGMILYGEWLVKHSVKYPEGAYKKFYLFDIWLDGKLLTPDAVMASAHSYGIQAVPYVGEFLNPTVEELKAFVGKSSLGESGEGIVIKNMNFTNKFGDLCYAKMVCENFQESRKAEILDNDNESYIVSKYMTVGRVVKIMNKLQPEINERLDMCHIPRICNSAYHDMITEEIWEITKKVEIVNLKILSRLSFIKAKQLYINEISK